MLEPAHTPERELVRVDLDQLSQPFRLRGEQQRDLLIPLGRSIQESGVICPAIVDQGNRVIKGHRTLDALALLNRKTITVLRENREFTDAEALQWGLSDTLHVPLKPTELALGLKRYQEATGLSQKETAGKLGMSTSAFTHAMAVLDLPVAMQEAIDSGELPKSAAYSLSRIADPEQQVAMARRLMDGEMTRDALIGEVRASLDNSKSKTLATRKLARGKALLADGRSVTVSGEQLTLESFIETIEVVLAKARRCRTRGVDLPQFLKVLRSESKSAESVV